jgi:hypothetical protein
VGKKKPGVNASSDCLYCLHGTASDSQRENGVIWFSAMGTIAPPNNTLKGKRVLLVEDEALVAM